MSGRSEEAQQDHQRPKPVRFSIFGQIQQQAAAAASLAVQKNRDSYGDLHHHHVSIKADAYHHHEDSRYEDDDEEDELVAHEDGGGDQPLDFSAKKPEPQITAKVMAVGGHHHDHYHASQAWGHHLPMATSHSSESGVSDLCSNSPQSDGEPSSTGALVKSPISSSTSSGSPTAVQQQPIKAPVQVSPLPAALSAIYGPLAALQNGRQAGSNAMDPTLSAATSQLLSNLAAVTNGGKGGKNTRPFKAYPRDPMSLPLGLYGLPMAGNAGEETVMTQASNDAYAEFRRQMLSQVNATKSKRKTSISNGGNNSVNGNSRPNSVTGDEDMDMNGHNDNDMPEATHIRGTVSVTDMRLVSGNEDDSEHSGNDSIHHAPMKSPPNGNGSLHIAQHYADLSGLGSSSSPMMLAATTSNGSAGSAGSASKKRGRNGEEIKDDAYWERRRKNNEAAKRSRDARRAKEDEIAIRAAFLEQENLKLRFELANLKNETAKLRCMIYNS